MALIILCLASKAQLVQTLTYRDGEMNCEYHLKDGMFDGDYVSYHSNGVKKSQGKFCMNNRCGEWICWDSTGKIRWKRIYSNNFSFEQSFPKTYKRDLPERDKSFYKYSELKEQDISWDYRLYRNVGTSQNPFLASATLNDLLLMNILSGKIIVFSEDQFLNPFLPDTLKKKLPTTSKLIALKIREEAFIDSTNQFSETRIIGFNPIFVNGKDSIDIGWIYYPSLRSLLAGIPFTDKRQPFVQNIEDVFHFRFFASSIYRDYRPFSVYCKTPAEFYRMQELAELSIIEAFHEEWDWTKKFRK